MKYKDELDLVVMVLMFASGLILITLGLGAIWM